MFTPGSCCVFANAARAARRTGLTACIGNWQAGILMNLAAATASTAQHRRLRLSIRWQQFSFQTHVRRLLA